MALPVFACLVCLPDSLTWVSQVPVGASSKHTHGSNGHASQDVDKAQGETDGALKASVREEEQAKADMQRRAMLAALASPVLGGGFIEPVNAYVPLDAIVVVGAGGQTGKLVMEVLAKERTPRYGIYPNMMNLRTATPLQIANEIRNGSAVIFAATASPEEGNAVQIDELAALNVARACLIAKVGKFVYISAGGVTRPSSLSYQERNKVPGPTWGLIDAKRRAESRIKNILRGSVCKFTILRPGVMVDVPGSGVEGMEINQGDAIGGLISRADVAKMATVAAVSEDANDVSFEVYAFRAFGKSRAPVEKGLPKETGFERRDNEWEDILRGLRPEFARLECAYKFGNCELLP